MVIQKFDRLYREVIFGLRVTLSELAVELLLEIIRRYIEQQNAPIVKGVIHLSRED